MLLMLTFVGIRAWSSFLECDLLGSVPVGLGTCSVWPSPVTLPRTVRLRQAPPGPVAPPGHGSLALKERILVRALVLSEQPPPVGDSVFSLVTQLPVHFSKSMWLSEQIDLFLGMQYLGGQALLSGSQVDTVQMHCVL